MRNTRSSRRISSAMASRSASRTVCFTVAPVHSGSASGEASLGGGGVVPVALAEKEGTDLTDATNNDERIAAIETARKAQKWQVGKASCRERGGHKCKARGTPQK